MGYRPHPQKRTKNHSFVPLQRPSHRSWATAHTRKSAEEVIRLLPLAYSWATAHTRTSPPRITRSCRYSVPHIVRGLSPTPAQAQKKSFARYRSLIRGLPPTPVEAHQESLVRAAIASLTSFVGYRPHPHKRRRSHSLATARSFVGYRPHPHKRTKNHSFVPLQRPSHRSWATAHTRKSAEEVIRSLPLAHSWATAHTRRSAPRITRSCRYSVPHIVRGLPPTPAEAHQESLVRAATASLTSFVGYRPHPQKRTKNRSFVPLQRPSHRSWATAHTRKSAEEVIRSLPLAHSWATAHTRKSAEEVIRSLPLAHSWATAHTRRKAHQK